MGPGPLALRIETGRPPFSSHPLKRHRKLSGNTSHIKHSREDDFAWPLARAVQFCPGQTLENQHNRSLLQKICKKIQPRPSLLITDSCKTPALGGREHIEFTGSPPRLFSPSIFTLFSFLFPPFLRLRSTLSLFLTHTHTVFFLYNFGIHFLLKNQPKHTLDIVYCSVLLICLFIFSLFLSLKFHFYSYILSFHYIYFVHRSFSLITILGSSFLTNGPKYMLDPVYYTILFTCLTKFLVVFCFSVSSLF